MNSRTVCLLGTAIAYMSVVFTPISARAQDAGSLIGGLAGGMIGGMIAGSMARQNGGGGYYRRSYSKSYARPRTVRVKTAPRISSPASGGHATAIDAASDPFAKSQPPQTTAAGIR